MGKKRVSPLTPSWVPEGLVLGDPADPRDLQVEALYTCLIRSPQAAQAFGEEGVTWLDHVGPHRPGYKNYRGTCEKRVSEDSWRAWRLGPFWICEASCHDGKWWPLLETVRFTFETKPQKVHQKNAVWFNFKGDQEPGQHLTAYESRSPMQVAYERKTRDQDQLCVEILESQQVQMQMPMQMQMQLFTQTTTFPLDSQMRQSPTRSAAGPSEAAGPSPKRPREDDNWPGTFCVPGYTEALAEPNTPLVFTPPSNITDTLNALLESMDATAESQPASHNDDLQRNVERGMRALGTALNLDMELLPQDAISRYARCLVEQRGFNGPEFLRNFTHSRDGTPLESDDTYGQLQYVVAELGLPEDVVRAEAVRASENRYLSQLQMILSNLDVNQD